jgi:hypothetical protein
MTWPSDFSSSVSISTGATVTLGVAVRVAEEEFDCEFVYFTVRLDPTSALGFSVVAAFF